MFTLIKREIEDNMAMLMLAAFATLIFTSTIVYVFYNIEEYDVNRTLTGIPNAMFIVLAFYWICLALISAVFGAAQTYLDRSQKISTFLSTRATTRRRILSAKIIAGLLLILLSLMPFIAACIILLRLYPPVVLDTTFIVKILTTMVLSSLTCYTLGLQMGWQPNKSTAILGSLLFTPVLLSVIIIKGFGFQSDFVLALFAIAMLVRTWQRFMSTAL